jgi:cytochrome c5
MSDAHQTDDHDSPHEGPIKTPKQLIVAVVFSFLVPIIAIILLVNFVAAGKKEAAGSTGLEAEAVARRIQPVSSVEVKDASDIASLKTGEQVYTAQCSACHATGMAGAPKFGDAGAWGPRIGQGVEALVHSALKGKGAMGAQGGGDFTDFEIQRAVVFMANKGGASFPEPKAPAATTADAAAPAAAAADPAAASAAAAAIAAANTAAPAADTGAAAAVPALYAQTCQACHAAGIAGAPKVGDKAAWAPRIAEGMDTIMKIVTTGKGAMPPRGGSSASDAELKTVVEYMVNASK